MKRKLVTIKRLKQSPYTCDLHSYEHKGHIRFEIDIPGGDYFLVWLCDTGLAELIAALNEAAEKAKPGVANEG